MTQIMYAHMNKIKIFLKKCSKIRTRLMSLRDEWPLGDGAGDTQNTTGYLQGTSLGQDK
jgi:hypothetical protein